MVDCRNAIASGERHKLVSSRVKERIILNDQSTDMVFCDYREVLFEVPFGAGM